MIVCVDPEVYEDKVINPMINNYFIFLREKEKAETVWGRGSAKLMKEYKA